MDGKLEVRPGSELADVIDKIEHGESFDVVHHGNVVARLVPTEKEHDSAEALAAMERIAELSKGVTLGPDLTIKQLVDEGRKY